MNVVENLIADKALDEAVRDARTAYVARNPASVARRVAGGPSRPRSSGGSQPIRLRREPASQGFLPR